MGSPRSRAQTRAPGPLNPRPAPYRPALISAPLKRAHFVSLGPRGSLGFPEALTAMRAYLLRHREGTGSPPHPVFLCNPQVPVGAVAVPLPPVPCP